MGDGRASLVTLAPVDISQSIQSICTCITKSWLLMISIDHWLIPYCIIWLGCRSINSGESASGTGCWSDVPGSFLISERLVLGCVAFGSLRPHGDAVSSSIVWVSRTPWKGKRKIKTRLLTACHKLWWTFWLSRGSGCTSSIWSSTRLRVRWLTSSLSWIYRVLLWSSSGGFFGSCYNLAGIRFLESYNLRISWGIIEDCTPSHHQIIARAKFCHSYNLQVYTTTGP